METYGPICQLVWIIPQVVKGGTGTRPHLTMPKHEYPWRAPYPKTFIAISQQGNATAHYNFIDDISFSAPAAVTVSEFRSIEHSNKLLQWRWFYHANVNTRIGIKSESSRLSRIWERNRIWMDTRGYKLNKSNGGNATAMQDGSPPTAPTSGMQSFFRVLYSL